MRCEMYKCRDNSCGVCTCKYPIIGENCTCLAYIPMESKEAELHEQIDKMTDDLFNQLGLPPVYFAPEMTSTELQETLYKQRLIHADFAQKPDFTGYPDPSLFIDATSDIDDVELSEDIAEEYKPDGNCLTCKYQYYDNMQDYCAICPGDPEDI